MLNRTLVGGIGGEDGEESIKHLNYNAVCAYAAQTLQELNQRAKAPQRQSDKSQVFCPSGATAFAEIVLSALFQSMGSLAPHLRAPCGEQRQIHGVSSHCTIVGPATQRSLARNTTLVWLVDQQCLLVGVHFDHATTAPVAHALRPHGFLGYARV